MTGGISKSQQGVRAWSDGTVRDITLKMQRTVAIVCVVTISKKVSRDL